MHMAVLFFPRKTSNHRWNAVRKLKEHARTAINADDETIVTISERDCGDPSCGGARTIVLIMHPRRPTEAVGIGKPLEQITQTRSEEHTSELQSSDHLVCRLLLEKKKQNLYVAFTFLTATLVNFRSF